MRIVSPGRAAAAAALGWWKPAPGPTTSSAAKPGAQIACSAQQSSSFNAVSWARQRIAVACSADHPIEGRSSMRNAALLLALLLLSGVARAEVRVLEVGPG